MAASRCSCNGGTPSRSRSAASQWLGSSWGTWRGWYCPPWRASCGNAGGPAPVAAWEGWQGREHGAESGRAEGLLEQESGSKRREQERTAAEFLDDVVVPGTAGECVGEQEQGRAGTHVLGQRRDEPCPFGQEAVLLFKINFDLGEVREARCQGPGSGPGGGDQHDERPKVGDVVAHRGGSAHGRGGGCRGAAQGQ